jgi:acyl-CoA synthetase (AMP-forming)/AMP-acid ligase II/acyl carrier protein
MVPLSHSNLLTSADNICRCLQLTAEDRCLNVMPLFHIHGLVGALLASLAAGGSIACSPGFEVQRFWEALRRFRPTWYTAVPTIHQAILAEAEARADGRAGCSLRFIRSCSSSLPPAVMDRLEKRFRVPVVEAYGMTEAAHQMTCNPLPPSARKPGSVGIPTGVEVAIMDEGGRLLPAGATGEVVIRGGNVTAGYANNPEANEKAYADGWFRTGDQGHFDRDGYLFLTGRLKEMINRGGENISPREIDEALMEHPDVAQAIAFAVPHPTLGEHVAAAIVLRPEASLSESGIREFAAGRLSDFKVPQQVVFLDEIPKGPTGKPQRIGLADKLGLVGEPDPQEDPKGQRLNPVEQEVAEIWKEVLSRTSVARDDNFFHAGGDSLRATQILNRVRDRLGVQLPLSSVFQSPTLGALAQRIAAQQSSNAEMARPVPRRRQAG